MRVEETFWPPENESESTRPGRRSVINSSVGKHPHTIVIGIPVRSFFKPVGCDGFCEEVRLATLWLVGPPPSACPVVTGKGNVGPVEGVLRDVSKGTEILSHRTSCQIMQQEELCCIG
jgi:hypothetical protein